MLYKFIIRKFFFLFNPESAHAIVFRLLKIFQSLTPLLRLYYKSSHKYDSSIKINGITFPNRIGIAAGLDKDAEVFDALGSLGFGHIEVGTLTPKPQPGNPRPRLFRLVKDKALINRMGFNNKGSKSAVKRLSKKKTPVIVGGNIGKNKTTPNEQAKQDYLTAFEDLYEYVDYFVVNVSSPNTPGLRDLQNKKPLTEILSSLQEKNKSKPVEKPIFLKIAPDLTYEQIDDIIEIVNTTKIAGIIATNTTITRENLKTSQQKIEKIGNGGLSGKPLKNKSTEIIRYIRQKAGNELAIIGVGGIFTPQDAIEKIEAGADLVQIFTGFIYEGPSIAKKINKALYFYDKQRNKR
jgi:dihydroorotate dehydrogenase